METTTVPQDQILAFLETIHADADEGHIELRLLVDRATGEKREPSDLITRRWYPSAGQLAPKLAGIIDWAKARRSAVFFGVLPRKDTGMSKADDTVSAAVLWADLDFKDYAKGEKEARTRIGGLAWKPSITVATAHGVHLYWLLSEAQPPKALSDLSRRLGAILGADSCHDAARMLRLPGSWNMKDPARAVQVVIEDMSPDHRYHYEDLDEQVPALPERPTLGEGIAINAPTELTRNAKAILDGNQQIKAHWEGRGKSSDDDTTSSGYDFTVAVDVLFQGGTAEDAASAVLSRPDGAARAKPARHLRRTVGRAQAYVADRKATYRATQEAGRQAKKAETKRRSQQQIDEAWKPDSLAIYTTDPPRLVLTSGPTSFEMSVAQLMSRAKTQQRIAEALFKIVELPPHKGGAYQGWVDAVLSSATHHEQPPEASRWGGIDEEVRDALETVGQGDCVDDFYRGMMVPTGERWAIRLKPLLASLRHDNQDLTRPELAQHLREIGWRPQAVTIDGKQARAWVSPEEREPEDLAKDTGHTPPPVPVAPSVDAQGFDWASGEVVAK